MIEHSMTVIGPDAPPSDHEWEILGHRRARLHSSQQGYPVDAYNDVPFKDIPGMVMSTNVLSVIRCIEADRDKEIRTHITIVHGDDDDDWVAELMEYWSDRDLDAVDKFLCGPDQGMSSAALIAAVCGRVSPENKLKYNGYLRPESARRVPVDADSFRRCSLALAALKECGLLLADLRDVLSSRWSPIITRWAELELLLREDNATRMNEILDDRDGTHVVIDTGEGADGWTASVDPKGMADMLSEQLGFPVTADIIINVAEQEGHTAVDYLAHVVPCACCSERFCNIHLEHWADCPCPGPHGDDDGHEAEDA